MCIGIFSVPSILSLRLSCDGLGTSRESKVAASHISRRLCDTTIENWLALTHVVSPQICSQNFFRRLESGVAVISGALLELIFIRNNTISVSLDLDE